MATPRGATHKDLEQRIRDLEAQVRALTGATLRRKQLGVTEGDFVVTGGGSVIVQDAGNVQVQYPSGEVAVLLGDVFDEVTEAYQGTGLLVQQEDGTDIATIRTAADPEGAQILLRDKNGDYIFRDDPSGGGLASPDLAYPVYRVDTYPKNDTTSWMQAFWGDGTHWQPKLKARVYGTCPAGTTGQIKLVCGGVDLDTVTFTSDNYYSLEGLVPSFHPGLSTDFSIMVRRSAGTVADVGVRMMMLRGAAA